MIDSKHYERMVFKVARLAQVYENYLIEDKVELDVSVFETVKPLYSPPKGGYKPIKTGESWGEPFGYGWFRIDFKKAESLKDKRVRLFCQNDAIENLIFVDGVPSGMFDMLPGKYEHWRVHRYFDLPIDFQSREIILEGYASHLFVDAQPYDTPRTFARGSEIKERPVHQGIFAVTVREDIEKLVTNLYLLNSLHKSAEQHNQQFLLAKTTSVYKDIFGVIHQMPSDGLDIESVKRANKLLDEALKPLENKPDLPHIGIVGHSHLDTAWLWTVEEGKHKLARTVSNAVKVLKKNKEYKFMMSMVLYMDWLKNLYPALYKEVVELIKEKRFEINGAVWVECDCNITGAEAMVRQFVKGQLWLKENLGITNDSFWLPDTFGYSAALPQIMNKCGVKYFLTTKMSWNDTNIFPYDTFYWQGLDGSKILTHLNSMHGYADPESINRRANSLPNKNLSTAALAAYGFGDGGGGPDERMFEIAHKASQMDGVVKAEHTTVSDFMQKLEKSSESTRYPTYNDELYLELHRGTLTSNHQIKKLNRRLEDSLHNAELISAFLGEDKQSLKARTDDCYAKLLLNQFHDILPGTCITEVYPITAKENSDAIEECRRINNEVLTKAAVTDQNSLTVFNTLSFSRTNVFYIDGSYEFVNAKTQSFVDLDGNTKTAVYSEISALSSKVLNKIDSLSNKEKSPFAFKTGNGQVTQLNTPFFNVEFDSQMFITSCVDKRADREIVNGKFNSFLLTDDVPKDWDSWDIDSDYVIKSRSAGKLKYSKIISNGKLQIRIRNGYQITDNSEIVQDIVFNSMSAQIDFETKLIWNDVHKLLKAEFDTNINAKNIKNEIQFGYVERPTTENNLLEKAKFEVCNHKYSDLSENRYGIAFLNDCKYGLSCRGPKFAFTLLKSGTHPNTVADSGTHYMTYSILPHDMPFGAQSVVQPAYELNNKPIVIDNIKLNFSSPISVDKDNIIIETIKIAEDGNGTIIRMYECERNRTKVKIKLPDGKKAELTDMLEQTNKPFKTVGGFAVVEFAPFEIVTIRIY